jgi:sn-glycerol 3-phosphate transport system ATP-binding protein
MQMSEISIRAVSKAFGATEVLKGVDLTMEEGDLTVILGPSGCGKSTLLRLIAGLEAPDAGDILIGGATVLGREPRDRGCAMVFQNYALYPHMSVAENIAYGLRVEGLRKAERRARVEGVAHILELDGLLDRKPAQLSGGQRQRVAMARAIIRSPRVFLFDEPLSNLDAKLRVQMRQEVRRVHERVGATSVFVTHDQVEAMTLADRLVVMNAGRIEQTGAPAQVYDAPASLFVARFLGSPPMGILSGRVAADGAEPGLVLDTGERLSVGPRLRGLDDGRPLRVGVRPEALGFANGGSAFRATHLFSEELGAARLHHFDVGGQTISMATPERQILRKGEVARLEIAPDHLHFFDPETEQRLRPSRA